jgi:hypothetical protein
VGHRYLKEDFQEESSEDNASFFNWLSTGLGWLSVSRDSGRIKTGISLHGKWMIMRHLGKIGL